MIALALIFLNNRLGCCVISWGYHFLALITGNSGKPFVATDKQIVADYSAIGGYVPGDDSTDQGCNEQTALNYWASKGYADGSKLLGWTAIDATVQTRVKQAIWLFESVMFGIQMPSAWVNEDMPQANGFVWDVAGRPVASNGHCFGAVGYTEKGVLIDTWGLIGTITWAAVAKYAVPSAGGELYVLMSESMLIKANLRSPNGIDEDSLVADMEAFGATIAGNFAPDPDPLPPAD